jgi:pimeloyl-ACP methyl ester carboxylesterase
VNRPTDSDWGHAYAHLGDVRLHYVEAGTGPLVVLLHGFPDFWYSWRNQIPRLAAAGFRVVAVDLRGFNLSDKPPGIGSYRSDLLTRDVGLLIEALGEERASVIGHDWGAIVAWLFAMHHPERLERLAILNVPHPSRFVDGARNVRQLLKSWYIFFFQLPLVPEALIRRNDFALLRRLLESDATNPKAFTADDIERYVEAARRPRALTSALNYYRALLRRNPLKTAANLQVIEQPTLVLWGEKDRYLESSLVDPSPRWVPRAEVRRFPNASHWVHMDEPDEVNRMLIDFLRPVLATGRAGDRIKPL